MVSSSKSHRHLVGEKSTAKSFGWYMSSLALDLFIALQMSLRMHTISKTACNPEKKEERPDERHWLPTFWSFLENIANNVRLCTPKWAELIGASDPDGGSGGDKEENCLKSRLAQIAAFSRNSLLISGNYLELSASQIKFSENKGEKQPMFAKIQYQVEKHPENSLTNTTPRQCATSNAIWETN